MNLGRVDIVLFLEVISTQEPLQLHAAKSSVIRAEESICCLNCSGERTSPSTLWVFVFWVFFGGTGFELRASHLLGRSCIPSPFALVIFEIKSHFMPRLAWTEILLFVLLA
jgi:hypothetical protein